MARALSVAVLIAIWAIAAVLAHSRLLPSPFDVSASPDPDFPPRPAPDGEPGLGRPNRQSLGFAAAPVPVDYAPPQAPDFTVPSRAAGLVLSGDRRRPPRAARPPRAPRPARPR